MTLLRHLRDRARALDPRVADVLLALLVLADGLAELALMPGAGLVPAAVAAVALLATAVLLRRRVPLTALALAYGGLIAGGTTEEVNATIGPFATLLFVVVSTGGRLEERRFAAGLVVATALATVAIATDTLRGGVAEYAFGILLSALAPMFLGRFLQRRAVLNRTLLRKAEALERERGDRARAAVVAERTRIASELHDAVAHALSGMIIQASAARRLSETDPDRARVAFTAVEDSGREALVEMRRLLGVLRREDAGLALDPQPSLAHLSTLVRRAEEVGLPVEVKVSGDAPPLAPGLDLTAYRVVQEALFGAVQADAHSASIRLAYSPDRLEIVVTDDGGAPARGRSLLGLRERLTIYGGELTADARGGSGHAVRARIPLGAAA